MKWSPTFSTGLPPLRRRSEEHTSELQSPCNVVCRLLLEKKNTHRRLGRDIRTCRDPHGPAVRTGTAGHRCLRQQHPDPFDRRVARGQFFFFNDTAATGIYTLSLPDAVPI